MVNKKDLTSDDVRSQHGGGLGIRTLATVTRPNDLANRPLQPLESMLYWVIISYPVRRCQLNYFNIDSMNQICFT